MPKWLLPRTATQPVPTVSAFSMANRFAHGPTINPRPLSPSTVAVPAVSRTMVISGAGLIRPLSSIREYACSRAMP